MLKDSRDRTYLLAQWFVQFLENGSLAFPLAQYAHRFGRPFLEIMYGYKMYTIGENSIIEEMFGVGRNSVSSNSILKDTGQRKSQNMLSL